MCSAFSNTAKRRALPAKPLQHAQEHGVHRMKGHLLCCSNIAFAFAVSFPACMPYMHLGELQSTGLSVRTPHKPRRSESLSC